jgi:hypothetical protein
VCDLETSRIGAPYIYDISNVRVNYLSAREVMCITALILRSVRDVYVFKLLNLFF